MNRHETRSDELDQIGSKLIASLRLSESEIESIAGSPFLFSGVKARIGAKDPQPKPVFGFGRRFALGFGSLFIVMGIAAVGLFLLRDGAPTITARQVHVPIPLRDDPVNYSKSDAGDIASSVPGPVLTSEKRTSPQYQNASYNRADDRVSTRRRPVQQRPPEIEFYPLAYAGDPKETVTGGRVLQVEMSRSSLFAMGFNIPIDNGAELVKADLLVGPDGVPRGIRLH